jgi:predicted nuclease of restriction endonuclease-like (RecB) superfamily
MRVYQAPQHLKFVQAPLAQISWYHHITLLDKVKEEKTRLFYIFKTIENGWTRDMMVNQIESQAFNRQGIQTSNFDRTIAPHESELIPDLFKYQYAFNFLQLDEKARERDLENALL